MAQAWKCSGLRWSADGPVLVWDGGRRSALTWGKRVAFGVAEGGVRTCVGARGHACPVRATVPGRSTGARCKECARLDRAHSVAADTIADDPRPYRVYLAWFGPGLLKVGITAEERGSARLLEQGAVCFTWLGVGPLMAARRTEELLRAALGVPDRIPYVVKRAVRSVLPATEAERAAEVAELHGRAVALGGWPESLARLPCRPVDHVPVFGLADLPVALAEVAQLVPGGAVSGRLVGAAGQDLHLQIAGGGGIAGAGAIVGIGGATDSWSMTDSRGVTGIGGAEGAEGMEGIGGERVVVLDTRLMTGWELVAAEGRELDVPMREFGRESSVQDGLF